MLSLLISIFFAAEPKFVDLDYKIKTSGLESLQGKVTLQDGDLVSINEGNRQYSFQANIIDNDELYITVHWNKDFNKTQDKIFTEIITFDGIKAEVETFNTSGTSTKLEIQPNIL